VGIGLNLYGFLEWVERADFYEPLALNDASVVHGTGERVSVGQFVAK
jgi:hypothetical protein